MSNPSPSLQGGPGSPLQHALASHLVLSPSPTPLPQPFPRQDASSVRCLVCFWPQEAEHLGRSLCGKQTCSDLPLVPARRVRPGKEGSWHQTRLIRVPWTSPAPPGTSAAVSAESGKHCEARARVPFRGDRAGGRWWRPGRSAGAGEVPCSVLRASAVTQASTARLI